MRRAARHRRDRPDRRVRRARGEAGRRRVGRRVRRERGVARRSRGSAAPSTRRPDRSRRRSPTRISRVVATPVTTLSGPGRGDACRRAASATHRHGRRLDEARRLRRGRRPGALHRRASGLRLRGARARARERRALPGRDLVPDAGRGDGSGALPRAARVRRVARRGSGRGGSAGARPARRAHEPPPARARERAPEPGRARCGWTGTSRSPARAARCGT